ncbi:hypothetical protein EDC22_10946 [Tepidamorphus gemmatus]|uniref:Uncharacterized protein n=1 Tax=Tepidamorphus gemmatus TaxID=747076 RepID=A0A4R3M4X2_9HYPH|nr:hypothetical protein [Tepidamorphus gemmatus]TCT08371.1 hypothetical protein EDC22_10946 [Tepidamorphus gemmatus]
MRMPAWATGACLILASLLTAATRPVVAEEIVLRGTLYEPGKLQIGTRMPVCGRTRTVVTADLGDYGASIGGFIVLNPVRLDRLSAATRLFVYSHECAHQLYGPGEEQADCYAARRGKAEGWLLESDIDQICMIFPHKSRSPEHPNRAERCAAIRSCFDSAAVPAAAPVLAPQDRDFR